MIKLAEKNGAITLAQKMVKGDDGGYYIPKVEEGVLSWTPSEDYMPQVEEANIAGPEGPKGESGIYVGVDEPTDPDILVWLVPTGEVDGYVMTEEQVKDYITDSLVEVEHGTY